MHGARAALITLNMDYSVFGSDFIFEERPLPEGLPLYATVRAALPHRGKGRLGIVLRVVRISEPCADGDDTVQTITFSDVRNSMFLLSVPTADLEVLELAHQALEGGHYLAVCGDLIDPLAGKGGGRRSVRMHIASLHRDFPQGALHGATRKEMAVIDALIDDPGRAPGDLFRHVVEEAHAILDVAADNLSPRFRWCEKLVVLQALSAGQLDEEINPRLSTYIFSEPGGSKRVLSRLSLLLSPAGAIVQPHNATHAGLTARVEQQARTGWVVHPGVIPRSNHGVCVLEDFHQFNRSLARTVRGTLLSILEDGKIAPQKAACASYETRAAIHINGNRLSSVFNVPLGKGPKARLEDLSLTFDLFSRIDVLVELDCDDDPRDSAIEMSKRPKKRRTPLSQAERQRRTRALKLLVARLLDRFPEVDMSAVEEEVGKLTGDLIDVMREFTAHNQNGEQGMDTDGLVRRLANSVRKLIGASARLDGRGAANRQDIECVWKLLSYKLEVVRFLCSEQSRVQPLGRREDVVRKAERAREQRWQEIAARFGGLAVSAAQVAALLGYNEKQVRRELRQRGLAERGGVFQVPTQVEWQEAVRQARLAELTGGPPAAATVSTPAPAAAAAAGEDQDYAEAGPEEPDGEPEFDDCLPEVPAAFEPILEGLGQIQEELHGEAFRRLMTVVQEEAVTPMKELMLDGLRDLMPPGTVRMAEYEAWMKWVLHPEWEVRALAVLSTYVNSGLPDRERALRDLLEDHPELPDRIKEGIGAAAARLRWYWEREKRAVQRRQQQMLQSVA